jgi:hypothetical protein
VLQELDQQQERAHFDRQTLSPVSPNIPNLYKLGASRGQLLPANRPTEDIGGIEVASDYDHAIDLGFQALRDHLI